MLVVKRTKNIILVLNSDAINTVIRYLLFRLCMRERRGGRRRKCFNLCLSIILLAPAFMFKTASVWVIHYIAIKFLESLTLRNISRCSNTPEPFASLGGYQSCKNIHYSTVFVVIADVILLFAQAFSNLILEPVHCFQDQQGGGWERYWEARPC